MILKKFFESPWGKTFPILLLFVVNIFFLGKNIPLSDGIRYWKTASDILNGFQNTTVIESHLLLNGPLYPFILAIFKGIGFTVKASIYLNAIFLYVAFTYFFKTAHLFLIQKKALIITYVLVLIDPFLFYWGAKLYSEPLAILLVCYNLYLISFYFKTFSNKTLIKVALIFCLLALTRVIFVYVLLVITMLGLIAFLILKNQKSKELFKLGAYGILFCIPYMIFTYSITNKIFFMTANGGHLLYWISSPYEKDLGEWHTLQINHDHFAARYNSFSGLDSLYLRKVNEVIISEINKDHKAFSDSLKDKNLLEIDEALKQKAIDNIFNYPKSFLKNWILNIGRLLVGTPHAMYYKPPYSPFFSLLNTVKSSFLLCFLLISMGLFLVYTSQLKTFDMWLLLLILIYIGGQSLLAVQSQRFLLPIYPVILLFISSIFTQTIQLKKLND
jgi:hypothetical protein